MSPQVQEAQGGEGVAGEPNCIRDVLTFLTLCGLLNKDLMLVGDQNVPSSLQFPRDEWLPSKLPRH